MRVTYGVYLDQLVLISGHHKYQNAESLTNGLFSGHILVSFVPTREFTFLNLINLNFINLTSGKTSMLLHFFVFIDLQPCIKTQKIRESNDGVKKKAKWIILNPF